MAARIDGIGHVVVEGNFELNEAVLDGLFLTLDNTPVQTKLLRPAFKLFQWQVPKSFPHMHMECGFGLVKPKWFVGSLAGNS